MSKSQASTTWEHEILYTSGDDYFAAVMQAIERAAVSIELETYIFEEGRLGDRISQALIRASSRGVRVRVIVDGLGSPEFVWTYWPTLKAGGVRVRFFRVFPWILRRLPGDPKSFVQRLLLRLRQMNRGNHRKFCLIDSTDLFIGSFNVSDVHLREVYGNEVWQDLGVLVRGHDVRFARRAFQRAYRGWTALNWPTRSPKLLLLNDSFLHKRRTRLEHISRISKARERLWMATPYFVPTGLVYRLLARQARRGLDVRLLIPSKNDVWMMRWMSPPLLRDLATQGVRIFVYDAKFLHQKVLISDDWLCLGSTNINHRSFLHDLEMDVVITKSENRERILASYEADQALSHPFDTSEWGRLPWWKRWLSSIFRVAKYWS